MLSSQKVKNYVYFMQIEMPIDKAVDTLKRLGLLSEILIKKNFVLEVLPCSDAFEFLKRRWADLLE